MSIIIEIVEINYSATLIDEDEKQLSVIVFRTMQNTLAVRTEGNVVLELFSEVGERLISINNYDSVYLDRAIPSDRETVC